MLFEEARWLGQQLSRMPPDELYPMCNIGSSTEHYRQVEQPYIDRYLFAPARIRELPVIHVDLKPAAGVDMVGDLTKPSFLKRLANVHFRSVMCCNLLEHVTDRTIVRDAILSILSQSGYIIATVPYRFPYHEDPIDTMYRPTIEELAALFVGTSVHKAAVVRASRFAYEMQGNYRTLCRMIARASVPFYRPAGWRANLRKFGALMAGYQVSCVVLRKKTKIAG
jgi:hypothetical protein